MEHSKRSLIISEDEDLPELDLEDFLIADLVATIKDISDYCSEEPTAKIGNTAVTIDGQPVAQDARERLGMIVEVVRGVRKAEPHLPQIEIVVPVLQLDGWSLTKVTLRTPLWLRDVQEWPLADVAGWHKELECVETYTSS